LPRLSADQWETVRAEFEAGATLRELEGRHHVDKAAISRKAARGEWRVSDDVGAAIRAKVNAKVNRVVNSDPIKKAVAIDDAATRAAAVVVRHRRELEEHAELFQVVEIKEDFNIGKSAKICVEMLAIRQKAERTAWGLDEPGPKDLTKLSDAELEAMVRGK